MARNNPMNNMSNVSIPRVNPNDVAKATNKLPEPDSSDSENLDVQDANDEENQGNEQSGDDNSDGDESDKDKDKSDSSNGESGDESKDDESKDKKNKKDKDDELDDNSSKSKGKKGKSSDSNEDEGEGEGKDKKEQSTKEKAKQAKKKISAIQSALQAMQFMAWLSKFLMMMRMLLQALVNAVMSLVQAIVAAIMNVVNAIMGFASAVATFIGAPVAFVLGGMGSIIGAIVSVVVVVVVNNSSVDNAIRSDGKVIYDCSTGMAQVQSGMSDTDIDAQTLANAKLAYSVFSEYGLADNNIAGILANWDSESGIDPTSVETIFTEPFEIGPKKQAAWDNGFDIEKIDSAYAADYPAIDLCGIGLGQWTNGRNTSLLNYANAVGLPWHDMTTQLAFMITKEENGGDSGSSFLASWGPEDDAYNATKTFCQEWEGNKKAAEDESRLEKGPLYATEISSWVADVSYANSVIEMAGTVSVNATDGAARNVAMKCNEGKVVPIGNSSIANAAVSMAYATEAEGNKNNGNEVYQKVHDAILPGDTYYMACDRLVLCAVRWAGADDDYPESTCNQIEWLGMYDEWKEIDWGGDVTKLEPGDILICVDASTKHTLIYTGHEAIAAQYPDAPEDYMFVSASLNDRSPGCGPWHSDYGKFKVYRNVLPETDSVYKDLTMSDADAK